MSSKQSKRTIPINRINTKKKNVLKDGIKKFNRHLYNVCFDNTAAHRDTAGLERFFFILALRFPDSIVNIYIMYRIYTHTLILIYSENVSFRFRFGEIKTTRTDDYYYTEETAAKHVTLPTRPATSVSKNLLCALHL